MDLDLFHTSRVFLNVLYCSAPLYGTIHETWQKMGITQRARNPPHSTRIGTRSVATPVARTYVPGRGSAHTILDHEQNKVSQ